MGAKSDFDQLFQDFQSDDFFNDALYSFSWIEESRTINRTTGDSTPSTTTYSAQAFWITPSKSERSAQKLFKDIRVGDIAISVRQDELVKAPPLDTVVTFNSKNYNCKEVVSDTVGVAWKILLRE